MRAEIPGRFSALPTRASAMYAPELKANSNEIKLEVVDGGRLGIRDWGLGISDGWLGHSASAAPVCVPSRFAAIVCFVTLHRTTNMKRALILSLLAVLATTSLYASEPVTLDSLSERKWSTARS